MKPNVSYWLRAFRPPLQRAYLRLDQTGDDLEALLRRADQRLARGAPCADERKSQPA